MMLNFTVEDEWIIKQIYKRGYRNWKKKKRTKEEDREIERYREYIEKPEKGKEEAKLGLFNGFVFFLMLFFL